jgi:hypothetical protein
MGNTDYPRAGTVSAASASSAFVTTRYMDAKAERIHMTAGMIPTPKQTEEGDDLHPASALWANHRIDLIDLPDHFGPARRFVCPPRGFRVR